MNIEQYPLLQYIVTVVVVCSHPAANITGISCWDGLHIQFFICVNVFSDNWPK